MGALIGISFPEDNLVSFMKSPLKSIYLKSILYICISIPVLPLGSSEPFSVFVFRFHIYVLAYGIRFSLSDILQLRTRRGGRVSWEEVREWHGHIYTTKCKTDS